MFIAIIVVFILPNWPANTTWLTPAEKELAKVRLRADRVGVKHPETKMRPARAVLAALCDWRMYVLTFMYTWVKFGVHAVLSLTLGCQHGRWSWNHYCAALHSSSRACLTQALAVLHPDVNTVSDHQQWLG